MYPQEKKIALRKEIDRVMHELQKRNLVSYNEWLIMTMSSPEEGLADIFQDVPKNMTFDQLISNMEKVIFHLESCNNCSKEYIRKVKIIEQDRQKLEKLQEDLNDVE